MCGWVLDAIPYHTGDTNSKITPSLGRMFQLVFSTIRGRCKRGATPSWKYLDISTKNYHRPHFSRVHVCTLPPWLGENRL